MPSTPSAPPAARDVNATLHLLSEHTRLLRPRHDLEIAAQPQITTRPHQADCAWFEVHPCTHVARAQAAAAWGAPLRSPGTEDGPSRLDRVRLQGLLLGWQGALFTLGAGATLAALRQALTSHDLHGAPHALGPTLGCALATAWLTPLLGTQLAAQSYGAAAWGVSRARAPGQQHGQRVQMSGCCGLLVAVGLSLTVALLLARPPGNQEAHVPWAAQVGALALVAGLPAAAVLGFDGGILSAEWALAQNRVLRAAHEGAQVSEL